MPRFPHIFKYFHLPLFIEYYYVVFNFVFHNILLHSDIVPFFAMIYLTSSLRHMLGICTSVILCNTIHKCS